MSLNRFGAFSDGVFYDCRHVLVLEIKAPDLSGDLILKQSPEAITDLSHILSYVVSLLSLGQRFGSMHHALFHFLKQC